VYWSRNVPGSMSVPGFHNRVRTGLNSNQETAWNVAHVPVIDRLQPSTRSGVGYDAIIMMGSGKEPLVYIGNFG
jgi:hypothetical protein